jgi:hypothetical protein
MAEEGFKVPKNPARVVLDVPPDPPAAYTVYVSDLAERHRGRETVSDVLDAGGRFVPVVDSRGQFALINKQAVRWVKVLAPEEAEWLFLEEKDDSPRIGVRCEFHEGDRLEGVIYAMTPEGKHRAQDVVNCERGFLHLEAEDGLYLVNLALVKNVGVSLGPTVAGEGKG